MHYYLPHLEGRDATYALPEHSDYGHCAMTAEEAAEDFFFNHDGWELRTWPITIVLVGADGAESRWRVQREDHPQFDATKERDA